MTELERKVLEALERRQLTPRPLAYFMARRAFFWTIFALSIVLGAVASATIIYAITDYIETGGAGFDEMPFDDVFETLPYLWIGVLALLTASAFFSFRNTPRGYRWKAWLVAGGAAGASLALGALLHWFDVGRGTHQLLLANFPPYERLMHSREDEWRRPDEGYLGGWVLGLKSQSVLLLRGFDGQDWTVDLGGADIMLDEELGTEEIVAIRGTRTGPASFHARTVEEWD